MTKWPLDFDYASYNVHIIGKHPVQMKTHQSVEKVYEWKDVLNIY